MKSRLVLVAIPLPDYIRFLHLVAYSALVDHCGPPTMRASTAGFSIVSKSPRASACGLAFPMRCLTDPMDDTADDPIDVPGVPRDDPVEDSSDDLSDDLTDDPANDPTDDPTDVPDFVQSVVPADDSIVDLSSMDLEVPTVVPIVTPPDDPADDPTDDPAYLIWSTKFDDPPLFVGGRQDRAAMTTSAASLVSVRISSASLAIVSESRRAPKSRRAFSWRIARTSSADPPPAECVVMDKSDIVFVSNVAPLVSGRRSFASSSRDRSRSATCARSASFSARHDSSSSAASVSASALGSDDALPATALCLREGKGSLRISTML